MEENLSKALIMTAEVLIGILLLTVMVYLFSMARDYSAEINDNIRQRTIAEFNARFEGYNQKDNLVAQDVVTLANLIHSYNTQESTANPIELQIKGIENGYVTKLQRGPTKEEAIEFMQSYEPYVENGVAIKKNFSCNLVYEEDGNIIRVEIKRTN